MSSDATPEDAMQPASLAPTPDDPVAAVTLDLENNWGFESDALRYRVLDHLDRFVDLVERVDVPLSVFVVGRLLEERPDAVRRLDDALDVELHLHSYSHDPSGDAALAEELRLGVEAFDSVLGRRPEGYRAPLCRVEPGDLATLSEKGFDFDASVCPSYRPGVYNNLGLPRRPYYPAGAPDLLEFPMGVQPHLRVPLEQSYLRLLGRPLAWLLRYGSLPNVLVFNVHLQDLYHTPAHEALEGVRRYLFTRNIENSVPRFEWFVDLLREEGYRFERLGDLAGEIEALRAASDGPAQRA